MNILRGVVEGERVSTDGEWGVVCIEGGIKRGRGEEMGMS